jgi:hypothetical protein
MTLHTVSGAGITKLRDGRGGVRITVGAGYLPLLQNVHTGSGLSDPPIEWVPWLFSRGKAAWV